MLVFWRERLIFLATPKTASTAVESALSSRAAIAILRPPQMKHATLQRVTRHLLPFMGETDGRDFAVTALMREPRDWLGSWYRYRQRPDEVPEKATRDLSFDQFVAAYCRPDQPEFAKVGSQANFLSYSGRNAPPLHIFRYEAMADFVRFLERRLNCTIELPALNVSPSGDLSLSPENTGLLKAHAAADFELYATLG